MDKNINVISQVLATVRGTLADHQEIQRAWSEIIETLEKCDNGIKQDKQ